MPFKNDDQRRKFFSLLLGGKKTASTPKRKKSIQDLIADQEKKLKQRPRLGLMPGATQPSSMKGRLGESFEDEAGNVVVWKLSRGKPKLYKIKVDSFSLLDTYPFNKRDTAGYKMTLRTKLGEVRQSYPHLKFKIMPDRSIGVYRNGKFQFSKVADHPDFDARLARYRKR